MKHGEANYGTVVRALARDPDWLPAPDKHMLVSVSPAVVLLRSVFRAAPTN